MSVLGSHLSLRLLWLAFGVGLGAYELSLGLPAHQIGRTFAGVGFVLFSIAWFLQPLPLTSPIRNLVAVSRQTATGSRRLRLALDAAGFLCLVIGVVLHFAFRT
jgi:Na+/phosphate symporter